MNQAGMLTRFVRDTNIDVVLVAGRYTLLDQRAADELLPAAAECGVGVIAGGVFNSGLLADPSDDARFDYDRAPLATLRRARKLKAICESHGVPLRAVAARFPLRHAAVSSVLIGARNPAEINDAIRLREMAIPAAVWDALSAHGGNG
jgi:D-threo-aldose 1-dehydrogenase